MIFFYIGKRSETLLAVIKTLSPAQVFLQLQPMTEEQETAVYSKPNRCSAPNIQLQRGVFKGGRKMYLKGGKYIRNIYH